MGRYRCDRSGERRKEDAIYTAFEVREGLYMGTDDWMRLHAGYAAKPAAEDAEPYCGMQISDKGAET